MLNRFGNATPMPVAQDSHLSIIALAVTLSISVRLSNSVRSREISYSSQGFSYSRTNFRFPSRMAAFPSCSQ